MVRQVQVQKGRGNRLSGAEQFRRMNEMLTPGFLMLSSISVRDFRTWNITGETRPGMQCAQSNQCTALSTVRMGRRIDFALMWSFILN